MNRENNTVRLDVGGLRVETAVWIYAVLTIIRDTNLQRRSEGVCGKTGVTSRRWGVEAEKLTASILVDDFNLLSHGFCALQASGIGHRATQRIEFSFFNDLDLLPLRFGLFETRRICHDALRRIG